MDADIEALDDQLHEVLKLKKVMPSYLKNPYLSEDEKKARIGRLRTTIRYLGGEPCR